MKLLLLVSLPFLASTNITLAKSTLNEGRQNVTDSLDMSPRAVRNLRQDTTAGTRHQAENAEERGLPFITEEASFKLGEEASGLLGKRKRESPETLFQKLNFEKKIELFRSQAFKDWILAVEESDEKGAGKTISKVLLENIPAKDLLSMPSRIKGGALSHKEYIRVYGYLISHWLEEGRLMDKLRAEERENLAKKLLAEMLLAASMEARNDREATVSKAFGRYQEV